MMLIFVSGLFTDTLNSQYSGHSIPGRICWEEVVTLPGMDIGHIRPGCELIDCCPGCPGPGELAKQFEIVVQIESNYISQITLTSSDQKLVSGLKVTGGEMDSKGSIRSTGNTLRIKGLNPVAREVPVFALSVNFNQGALKELKSQSDSKHAEGDKDGLPDGDNIGTVRIIQMIDKLEFSSFDYPLLLWNCIREPGPRRICAKDTIRLSSNDGADVSLIVHDGKRSACFNDGLRSTAAITSVCNVLVRETCNEEITVFSQDDAMTMSVNPGWTNSAGDMRQVNLTDMITVQLEFWVVGGVFANTVAQIVNDLIMANQVYNTSRCGLRFVANFNNATTDPEAAALQTADCGQMDSLPAFIGETANRLNVYYVNTARGARGWYCGNGRIIVGVTNSSNTTLAHEIGHAFTLGHTNGIDQDGVPGLDFPGSNIMMGGGVNRTTFSEGQCFRCNVNTNSRVNTFGLRPAGQPTRNCPDNTRNATCIGLEIDR